MKYKVKIVKFLNPDEYEWVEVEATSAVAAQGVAVENRAGYIGVESYQIQ